jgi:hypothetical protein
MTPQELRIGNYVLHDQIGEKYPMNDQVCINNFSVLKEFANGERHYLPILLTEEWLLKFGFIHDKDQKDFDGQCYFDHGIQVVFRDENYLHKIVVHYFGLPIEATIKHVHQLQNLYYALTQTELILES